MVESFLDFIHSPPDHNPGRTLSLAELDQKANTFGRPTQNQSPSFYSNLRKQSAGLAAVFATGPVASTVPGMRQQPTRDSKRHVEGSWAIPEEGSSGPGVAHHWRQPLVQPQVYPFAATSRLKEERREYLAGFAGLNQAVVKAYD